MPFTIHEELDGRAVVITYSMPHTAPDIAESFPHILAYRDDHLVKYLIANSSAITEYAFNEMVEAMAMVRGTGPGTLNDPQMPVVMVATHSMIRLSAEAAGQAQYSGKQTPIFATMDEARDYVKSKLGVA